jgi:heterodisulfide reductase subunit D
MRNNIDITGEKYSSLEDYYNSMERQSIDKCTYCGDCIRNCTLLPQTSVKDNSPEEVIRKIIEFLKDGVFSDEVYEKVFKCASCGVCTESCNEDIDILPAFEAAKMKLAMIGKVPEAVNSVMGIYDMWKVLSAIQTRPSEVRWLSKAPSSPQRVENVVFLGCTLPAFPHIVFPFLDILDRMRIDYIALAGGDLCCGFPLGPAAGLVGEAEKKIQDLVTNVKTFSPKRVILPCPGCYRLFTEIYPKLNFLEMDFEIQYYTQFLSENLKNTDFVKPINKQIVLHDSCMSRRTKVNESTIRLLEDIPGIKISKGDDICCGGTPMLTSPQITQNMAPAFIENLSRKTLDTGSEYLSNICQLCDMTFHPCLDKFPFEIKDIPALINMSLGGREYENKWLQYWKCKSIDELIEMTRTNFEENSLSENIVKEILCPFFHFANP